MWDKSIYDLVFEGYSRDNALKKLANHPKLNSLNNIKTHEFLNGLCNPSRLKLTVQFLGQQITKAYEGQSVDQEDVDFFGKYNSSWRR